MHDIRSIGAEIDDGIALRAVEQLHDCVRPTSDYQLEKDECHQNKTKQWTIITNQLIQRKCRDIAAKLRKNVKRQTNENIKQRGIEKYSNWISNERIIIITDYNLNIINNIVLI